VSKSTPILLDRKKLGLSSTSPVKNKQPFRTNRHRVGFRPLDRRELIPGTSLVTRRVANSNLVSQRRSPRRAFLFGPFSVVNTTKDEAVKKEPKNRNGAGPLAIFPGGS
jgi:hypothetical protein